MKLAHQYIAIFHPLQVIFIHYKSSSRLVVDEDDHGKFRLEMVNGESASSTSSYSLILVLSLVHVDVGVQRSLSPTFGSKSKQKSGKRC